jgi:dienelactone hydrolase
MFSSILRTGGLMKRTFPAVLVSLLLHLLFFGCAAAPVKENLATGDSGTIVFRSLSIEDKAFYGGGGGGTPATASGQLLLPAKPGKAPAVVLTHGSAGVRDGERAWSQEINRLGYAVFVVDSYSQRGITETATGRESLGTGSSIIDVYRALELLRSHPAIDPGRIALMGFSRGGRVTLNASMTRFQRKWLAPGDSFAAYLAFYPAIIVELSGQDQVDGQPIRIFQGGADDWTVPQKARAYVDQLRKKGRDAQIYEYPGAHHLFDTPGLAVKTFPNVLNIGKCEFREETEGGDWVDPATKERWSLQASCIRRGATNGYNADAYRQSLKDVEAFLKSVFKQ